ncbi:hypothetical protein [Clostridium estertheticum]|nr:hypothetical protein [Clostridium estertheticum]
MKDEVTIISFKKLNELALSYNISTFEKHQKQLDKVKVFLNKR